MSSAADVGHAARGHGLWAGAIAYDAGLGLLGVPSRHDPVVPAFAAMVHGKVQPLQWNIGRVQR